MTVIYVNPVNWDGNGSVSCLTTVTVDGQEVHADATTPDAYTLDSSAKTVSIDLLPTSDAWWRVTVVIKRQADGTLKTTDLGGAASVQIDALSQGMFVLLKVSVRLLRVRDATADFVAAFDPTVTAPLPPAQVPPGSIPAVKDAVDSLNTSDAYIRRLVDNDQSPILIPEKAITLQAQRTLVLDLGKADAGTFALANPAPVEPKNDTFVVEVGGMAGAAPRTIAVSWPHDVPPDKPAPMFVFFRHAPAQEITPVGVGKFLRDTIRGYPFSFDYACYGLLENLWYDVPSHLWPRSRGLPYQIEAAGKKVVTVVACPTVSVPKKSNQFGRWIEPAFMQDILLQIQSLFAASKGMVGAKQLGRVALGAFSSGNYYLGQLLQSPTHPFLTGTVKECYLFGPDNTQTQADTLPNVIAWQKAVTGGDGMVRLYNSLVMPEQKKLLPSAKSATPFFSESTDGHTSVSAIHERDFTQAIQNVKPAPARPLKVPWNGMQSHFAMSAFMLTHAMHKSGF
jgi:hypothetical protein